MTKIISILVLLISVQFSYAEEITKEKKLVIDEMLEITGALKVGEAIGSVVANQIIEAISTKKAVDLETIIIVHDEVGRIMHDEFVANGFVNELSYSIYHKYFTTAELKTIVAFYKTPTGTKLVSLLSKVAKEEMVAVEKHGQSLRTTIQERLIDRFESEGLF